MTFPAITRRTAIAAAAATGLGVVAADAATASAHPTGREIIMIIRHGEKPTGSGPPYGVTAAGDHDSNALTTTGWARAGAIAALLDPAVGDTRPGLARPASIYAARPTSSGANLRESETVGPLAARLEVSVHTPFEVGDEAELAATLRRSSGPILVCWEHKHIPAIAAHLGHVAPAVPATWPSDRFDVVWVFARQADGYRFTQVPQLLLAGDSASPIR